MSIHQNTELKTGSGTAYVIVPKDSQEHQVEVFGSGSVEVLVLSADNEINHSNYDLSTVDSGLWHSVPNNTSDLAVKPFYKKIRANLSGVKIIGGSYQYRVTSSDE